MRGKPQTDYPSKKLIKEIDQSAFSYVTDAREVNGYGFRTE